MIPVTPENAATVDFSHPYFASGLSLLVRAGAPPATLAALDGKTVAFRKQSFNDYGGELERVAKDHGVRIDVRYFPSTETAVAALARGEAAAMGGNFVDLDAIVRRMHGFSVDRGARRGAAVAVAVKRASRRRPPLGNARRRRVCDALGRATAPDRQWTAGTFCLVQNYGTVSGRLVLPVRPRPLLRPRPQPDVTSLSASPSSAALFVATRTVTCPGSADESCTL